MLDHRKGLGHTDLVSDLGASNVAPDAIEEADEESFPASNPPKSTRTITRQAAEQSPVREVR